MIIFGSINPLLIYARIHGNTAALIGVISFIIFMTALLMFSFTAYNTEKEMVSAMKESIKIKE